MGVLKSTYKFIRIITQTDYVGECRFHPTCSEYCAECYKKYDPFKATVKSAWRLLRCNPWNKSYGVDVP
ncbi:MAG TPA: membrane protein insertion efficiency factor YidD [Candidatus Paceibacterota bacterium]